MRDLIQNGVIAEVRMTSSSWDTQGERTYLGPCTFDYWTIINLIQKKLMLQVVVVLNISCLILQYKTLRIEF